MTIEIGWNVKLIGATEDVVWRQSVSIIPGVPDKAERWIKSVFMGLLYSTVMFFFFHWTEQPDPQITKFDRELFISNILWMSFSAFARFPKVGEKYNPLN